MGLGRAGDLSQRRRRQRIEKQSMPPRASLRYRYRFCCQVSTPGEK